MVEKLLAHPHWLVMLCIASVILSCELFDRVYSKATGRPHVLQLGRRILAVLSVILVALSYVTVFALTAIGMKLFGKSSLPEPKKDASDSYWSDREKIDPSLDYLKRQF